MSEYKPDSAPLVETKTTPAAELIAGHLRALFVEADTIDNVKDQDAFIANHTLAMAHVVMGSFADVALDIKRMADAVVAIAQNTSSD